MPDAFNNLIKFPLTPDMIEYWGETSIGDRIEDGYLNLRVNKNDYSLVTKGKGVDSKIGYRDTFATRELKRLGFRLKVRSQNEDLYLLLLELANYTSGEKCNLNPIEVIDYHHRHDRIDRDRCYRLRKGIFEGEFSNVAGTATQGYLDCSGKEIATGQKYGSGFSFKFMELTTVGFF